MAITYSGQDSETAAVLNTSIYITMTRIRSSICRTYATSQEKLRDTWLTVTYHFQKSPSTTISSDNRQHRTVRSYRLSTFGRPAFSDANATLSNSLPDGLLDAILSSDSFTKLLKTEVICELLNTFAQ